MHSSSWMANATHAARLISVALLSIVVVGCGTFKVERDKFYPADWPDIVGAAEDCHGIEDTFENKGVLVDEKGQRRDFWFTDFWLAPTFPAYDSNKLNEKRNEWRACEHVRLKLESFTYRAGFSDRQALRLIINPGRQETHDSQVLFKPCAEIRWPVGKPYPFARGGEPQIGTYCTKNSLAVVREWGGGTTELWYLGLASDGSLLVRWKSSDFLIFWVMTEDAWARFNKVP